MADMQIWSTSAQGGYLAHSRLSAELRYALVPIMKFRQFCDIKEDWNKGVGDTLLFDKISAVDTAGGTLSELSTIKANQFSISQGTIVLSEWGNSIPYTGKLEALARWDPRNPIERVLRDDCASVLDKRCGLEFKKTSYKYIATSTAAGTMEILADGDTLASGKSIKGGWRLIHVDDAVAELKRRKIPTYDNDSYICIASVNFLRELKKDSDWKNASLYGDPQRIFNGEVGRIHQVRFIEETNYLVNTLGSGGNYGEAVIFGKEAVMEGVAVPEEIRAKIPTDYGRSKGIAWYGIMNWKKMWKHADTNQACHIIHFCGTE